MTTQSHWDDIYSSKPPEKQTWHQDVPDVSLELIEEVVGDEPVRLVDIGGGTSRLVDHLLERAPERPDIEVSVVDISEVALAEDRQRLGERADRVEWVHADMTEPLDLGHSIDIWHDRAVFHFLCDADDREVYLESLRRHLVEGGHAIFGTFALDGPETCSGLPVQQYSAETLAETLGEDFQLVGSRRHLHPTPWGGSQQFSFAVFERC